MPVEPPPTPWQFPPVEEADEHGVLAVGADLEPGTLLAAYRQGIFPTPVDEAGPVVWWSPDPRGIIPLDGLHVSRSLRRSRRRFRITLDTAFEAVVDGCRDPARGSTWIRPDICQGYSRLHQLGWAHSVEVWDDEGLAGGLYGVGIGGFFAGESMFHRRTDASKVAVAALVELLRDDGGALFDVQWTTPHLRTLGAVDVSRARYLELLDRALTLPLPTALTR